MRKIKLITLFLLSLLVASSLQGSLVDALRASHKNFYTGYHQRTKCPNGQHVYCPTASTCVFGIRGDLYCRTGIGLYVDTQDYEDRESSDD